MIYGDRMFLKDNFERVEGGWIGFKIFNSLYIAPSNWKLKAGAWIEEPDLYTDPAEDCGPGINLACSVNWIQEFIEEGYYDADRFDHKTADAWRVFIPDGATIVVPWHSDGKIRVNRLQLIEIADTVYYCRDENEEQENPIG